MTTVAARGSGTPTTTGTTWATVTNAVDGAAGTNPATYTTYTNATASAVATMEITGYGFSTSIGASDTLNSVTVSLRHFENNTGRFASVRFQAFDGATAIGTATTCTLATAARNDVATPAVTLAQLRSSTFKIVVTITGAASTQSRVESVDYVDVTADYTITPPSITQAAYQFYADGTETGATAYTSTTTLADSYTETNADTQASLGDTGGNTIIGQSFLGNGNALARASFYIRKNGSPVGNVTAVLYAHTGTFGTFGTGTGTVLATSTTVQAAATLSTSDTWVDFDFDGTYTLTSGTAYVIGIAASGLGASPNFIYVRLDQTSPTHAGSRSFFGASWQSASSDTIFRVYTNNYVADTSSGDVNLQVRARLQSTTAVAVPATDDWQLQWEKTAGTGTLSEGYPATNADSTASISAVGAQMGQSFLSNGGALTSVGWYLSRGTSGSGNITAYLYAHTGTFGTDGVATGSPLATSTTVRSQSSLTTTGTWYSFDFDGTYTLTNGTPYVVACGTDGTGIVRNAMDVSSPTHPGVRSAYISGAWAVQTGTDMCFEVYTKAVTAGNVAAGGTVNAYASANLTDGAATTNRLGAGTGSFVAGKVSEDGLVDDLGWTANNYTEVLYSVTLKQADLAPADTLRFRVLRNAATTGMTYTVYPSITIGAGAPADRTGTATGAVTLSGAASGSKTVTATATGALTLTGTASGSAAAAPVLGTATGTLTVTGVAAGVHGVAGTATGTLTVAGAAAGTKTVTAVVSGSVTVAGTAVGVRGRPGVATGAITVAGVAAGTRAATGTATGSLTVAGTAAGAVTGNVVGTATGQLSLAGTATGQKTVRATAAGAITITGVAAGTKTVGATATGQLTLAGAATATKQVTATATGQIVLGSTALGLVEGNAVGTGSGNITLGGAAVGRRGTVGTATGTLTVAGTAAATKTVTATATGQVTLSGTATVAPPVTFEIVGEWNDQTVDAMQWGSDTVVEWFMLTAVQVNGTATGTITFGGTATGIGETPTRTGTATGVITIIGTASGLGETPLPPGIDVLFEPFTNFTTNSWSLYNAGGGNPSIVAGRTGTCARMTLGGEAAYLMAVGVRSEYLTFGFAYKLSAFAGQATIFRLQAGGVDHTRLKVNSDGSLIYTQPDGSTLSGSVPGVITAANTWHYIEVQTRLHDTLGAYTIRVNGATVVTGTGKDTRQGGTSAVYETLRLIEPFGFSGESNYVDDLYISTGVGATFKGDITIP